MNNIKKILLFLIVVIIINYGQILYGKNDLPENVKKYINFCIKDATTDYPLKTHKGIRMLYQPGFYAKKINTQVYVAFYKKIANNWEAFKQGKLEIISRDDKSLESVKAEILQKYRQSAKKSKYQRSKEDEAKILQKVFNNKYGIIQNYLEEQAMRIRFYFLGETKFTSEDMTFITAKIYEPFNAFINHTEIPYYPKEIYNIILPGYKNYFMSAMKTLQNYGIRKLTLESMDTPLDSFIGNSLMTLSGNKKLIELLSEKEIKVLREICAQLPDTKKKYKKLLEAKNKKLQKPDADVFYSYYNKKTKIKEIPDDVKNNLIKKLSDADEKFKRYEWIIDWKKYLLETIEEVKK